MRYFYIFLFLVLSISIASCGESGSTKLEPAPLRPKGSVMGVGFDGLIIDGVVTVYDYSNGVVGKIMGTTTTDFSGLYQLDLDVTASPILLAITGGRYVEEYSGRNITLDTTLGHQLRAVINYVPGAPVNVSITYYTNLAVAYAQYLIDNGENATLAVKTANNEFSALLNVNILATTPYDVTDPANSTASLESGYTYGFYTAAISAWTAKASEINSSPVHELFNSIAFARIAYEDLHADGLLDGLGYNAGQLSFGNIPLGTDTYRHELSVSILDMALSPRNKSSIDDVTLLPYADRLNQTDNVVYNDSAIIALDEGGAVITNVTPTGFSGVIGVDDNKWFKGTFTLAADVSSNIRITKIEFLIDGTVYAVALDLGVASYLIDTTVFTSAEHKVSVQVTNIMGTVAEAFVMLGFDNDGPCTVYATDAGSSCLSNNDCYVTGWWADPGIGKLKSASWSIYGFGITDYGDGTGMFSSGYKVPNIAKYIAADPIHVVDLMGNDTHPSYGIGFGPVNTCMEKL